MYKKLVFYLLIMMPCIAFSAQQNEFVLSARDFRNSLQEIVSWSPQEKKELQMKWRGYENERLRSMADMLDFPEEVQQYIVLSCFDAKIIRSGKSTASNATTNETVAAFNSITRLRKGTPEKQTQLQAQEFNFQAAVKFWQMPLFLALGHYQLAGERCIKSATNKRLSDLFALEQGFPDLNAIFSFNSSLCKAIEQSVECCETADELNRNELEAMAMVVDHLDVTERLGVLVDCFPRIVKVVYRDSLTVSNIVNHYNDVRELWCGLPLVLGPFIDELISTKSSSDLLQDSLQKLLGQVVRDELHRTGDTCWKNVQLNVVLSHSSGIFSDVANRLKNVFERNFFRRLGVSLCVVGLNFFLLDLHENIKKDAQQELSWPIFYTTAQEFVHKLRTSPGGGLEGWVFCCCMYRLASTLVMYGFPFLQHKPLPMIGAGTALYISWIGIKIVQSIFSPYIVSWNPTDLPARLKSEKIKIFKGFI